MSDKKRKVPKLRFPGFTDAWEQRKLGDMGKVSMCKRVFKSETSEIGEVPFYKIGTFGEVADSYISKDLFEEYRDKYSYPKVGDILISASGSIGRTVVYTGQAEYFQDSNIVWLDHGGKIDNRFLLAFYAVVKWSGIEGSTIKRLYNENILNTQIALPSLSEQATVGNFFREFDSLISLHQRKLDNVKMLKKSLLQKLFPKDGEKIPELRFPGFTDAWEQRKLEDLLDKKEGIRRGPFGSVLKKEFFVSEKEYAVYEQQNAIYDNYETRYYISKEKFEELEKFRIIPGDYILSGAGTVGKISMVPIDVRDGVINQALVRIRINDKVDPLYFLMWMRSPEMQRKLTASNPGSAMVNLVPMSEVKKWEILISKKEEQGKIGNFFGNLDSLISLHQRKLDHLKELKKGLLQQMFV